MSLDAGGGQVGGLGAHERATGVQHLRSEPPTHGCRNGQDAVKQATQYHWQKVPDESAIDMERHVARVAAREPRSVLPGRLECDVSARVSGTDHEHRAVAKLAGVAVVERVHLHDGRIEVAGKHRHVWLLEGGHRDDDVVGLEAPVAGDDQQVVPLARDPIDAQVKLDGKLEPARVRPGESRPFRPSSGSCVAEPGRACRRGPRTGRA